MDVFEYVLSTTLYETNLMATYLAQYKVTYLEARREWPVKKSVSVITSMGTQSGDRSAINYRVGVVRKINQHYSMDITVTNLYQSNMWGTARVSTGLHGSF